MYSIKSTTRFQKDIKNIAKRGYKMELLASVINTLASGQPLPASNRDHALIGNFAGCRECHIDPDWLLIYEIAEQDLILYLTRTGTHSDLFK